jgi:hypothetical protein
MSTGELKHKLPVNTFSYIYLLNDQGLLLRDELPSADDARLAVSQVPTPQFQQITSISLDYSKFALMMINIKGDYAQMDLITNDVTPTERVKRLPQAVEDCVLV